MTTPIDWELLGVPTPDGDIIDVAVESGAVPPNVVEFVLETPPFIRWWKGLLVPDGLGSSWEIWTQDDRRSDTISLWADQVHNGQSLELSKAKVLGIHTGMYRLGGLDRLSGGDRVTFRWVQDAVPDYNGGLASFSTSLPSVPGVGPWARPGEAFNVTTEVVNVGESVFSELTRYRIGSQDPQDNDIWGIGGRVALPADIGVSLGTAVTFTVVAPSEPGEYPCRWRMLQESVSWFGATVGRRIVVSPVRPTPPPPPPPPPPVSVPEVVGHSLVAAAQILRNSGLELGQVSGPHSLNPTVIDQSPPAGTQVSTGTAVDVTVETGVGGVARIVVANCRDVPVNVWAFDHATGQWNELAGSPVATGRDSSGSCPGVDAPTVSVDLEDGHYYTIIALDPSWCGGTNDPTDNACIAWFIPSAIPGASSGPTLYERVT